MDLEPAVVHRSVAAGGMGADPGIEAGASFVVVVVTVGVHSVAADLGSSHLILEARSHFAVDAWGVGVAWVDRRSARSWSGNVPEAFGWFESSLSVSDPVAGLHRRWMRKLRPVGTRMHGRSCLADNSGLAGCCSPPSGTEVRSRPTDEGRPSHRLIRTGP